MARGQESWQGTQLLWCQLAFSAVWRLNDETQGWPPQLHCSRVFHLNTHSRDHQCAGTCLWAQYLGGSKESTFKASLRWGRPWLLFIVRSLCSLDCPVTHRVDQASLQLTEGPPVPACLQACTTTPAWDPPLRATAKNNSSPKSPPFCVSKEEKVGHLHASNLI